MTRSRPPQDEVLTACLAEVAAGVGPAPSADLLQYVPEDGALSNGWLAAFGATLADATADAAAIERLLDVLREVDRRAAVSGNAPVRHMVAACAQIAGAFADRAVVARAPFAATSEQGRFLLAVADQDGASNEQISAATGLSVTQVSRTGRRMVEQRWVFNSRFGRLNAWTLTPNGLAVVPLVRAATPTLQV
jgi:DNA-binding MarR family transcriptional regulator